MQNGKSRERLHTMTFDRRLDRSLGGGVINKEFFIAWGAISVVLDDRKLCRAAWSSRWFIGSRRMNWLVHDP